jgi:ribosomal-protein-alanine N-acetyltransferase
MIERARRLEKTRLERLGPEWSHDCARLHGESFAFPWPEAEFAQLLATPEVVSTGAIDIGQTRLTGFAFSRAGADEAEVLTFAVARDRRGQGLGANLMAMHLRELIARGTARLFLEVDEGNIAARALYARFGFRQVGERKAYYRKEGAAPTSALVLRADLA